MPPAFIFFYTNSNNHRVAWSKPRVARYYFFIHWLYIPDLWCRNHNLAGYPW
jgi:hypothetical protein